MIYEKGETRLQKGGSRGTANYKDIRQYYCSTSKTLLIYIHLPTVFGQSALDNINYLHNISQCQRIHAIIFSAYHSDLNLYVHSHIEFNL